MKAQIQINYDWSRIDGEAEIPALHQTELRNEAIERILYMMRQGFTQGELHASIRFGTEIIPEEHEEDGIEYSGNWYSIEQDM